MLLVDNNVNATENMEEKTRDLGGNQDVSLQFFSSETGIVKCSFFGNVYIDNTNFSPPKVTFYS